MEEKDKPGKVVGIGGVFFTAANPAGLKTWYQQHLGLTGLFSGKDVATGRPVYTRWDVLAKDDPMFRNTSQDFCYRYRVDDLGALLEKLAAAGIVPLSSVREDESGRLAWVADPDNHLVELWQPSDRVPEVPAAASAHVGGMGGLFLKSANPAAANEWYANHLGFEITKWGCSFLWTDPKTPEAVAPAQTAWSIFKADAEYFLPSTKNFMLNYRVDDLKKLVGELEAAGVTLAGELQEFSYGKFAWAVDPDNNKIELWQPVDDGF